MKSLFILIVSLAIFCHATDDFEMEDVDNSENENMSYYEEPDEDYEGDVIETPPPSKKRKKSRKFFWGFNSGLGAVFPDGRAYLLTHENRDDRFFSILEGVGYKIGLSFNYAFVPDFSVITGIDVNTNCFHILYADEERGFGYHSAGYHMQISTPVHLKFYPTRIFWLLAGLDFDLLHGIIFSTPYNRQAYWRTESIINFSLGLGLSIRLNNRPFFEYGLLVSMPTSSSELYVRSLNELRLWYVGAFVALWL